MASSPDRAVGMPAAYCDGTPERSELRRAYRAARALATLPGRIAALEDRRSRAAGLLTVALSSRASLALPGYRVEMTPDGPAVRIVDVPADQLALWTREEEP